MNIVIIEDERPLADDLSKIIRSIVPAANITAIISSVEDGIDYLMQSHHTDLIFSDIQLGDGLSFDIFNKTENKIPVVFCTAFNHYALTAFEQMGIDYIVKPYSKQVIEKSIQKFRLLKQPLTTPDFNQLFDTFKLQLQPPVMPSVIVHQGEKIIPVSGADIALFFIKNETVFANTFQRKQWVINQKLELLEHKFVPAFYRANRQFLVNRKAIISAEQHFHRKVVLLLSIDFPEPIIVGKEKVTDFLNWLAQS